MKKMILWTFLFLTMTSPVWAQGISVNFDGAKVVYIDENNILKKINEQGNVSSVLNTDVAVSHILFTEQGNLFIIFQLRQRFNDGYDYLLARAVPTLNTISGIDKDLSSILWNAGYPGLSPGVQSDSAGNLYYFAYQNGKTVLKKCVNAGGSNIINLINENITINNWLVRPDGTILFSGSTASTGSKWLRKLTPENNLSSLAVGGDVKFILDFSDDRIYTGIWGSDPYFGVYKLPESLTSFDAYTPYISDNINNIIMTPEYRVSDIIEGQNQTYVDPFRGYFGSLISKCIKTNFGKTVVLADYGGPNKTIVQYYPTPEIIELTLIDKPTLIEKMSNLLLIAGTKNGVNKLVLYDPETSSEISLLNDDIEIYHLASLYDGYVWLDGLKFNGNRYVIGKIQITINPASQLAIKTESVGSQLAIKAESVGSFQEMATLSAKPQNLLGLSTGDPQIQVTPSTLNFGNVNPGSTKDLILEVKNIGTGALTGVISASPPFSIVSGGSYSLGANLTQPVIVRYTAPLQEGSQTGSLIFTGGGGITIQVKGTSTKVGLPWLMLLLD